MFKYKTLNWLHFQSARISIKICFSIFIMRTNFTSLCGNNFHFFTTIVLLIIIFCMCTFIFSYWQIFLWVWIWILRIKNYSFFFAVVGLEQDWCCSAEANLLRPDLVLLLTLSEAAQAQRGGFGNERYETPEIQKKVAANFELLFDDAYWKRIDAGKNIDDLHIELLALTNDTIRKTEETEIQLLRWKNV